MASAGISLDAAQFMLFGAMPCFADPRAACYNPAMTYSPSRPACPLDARERELIRHEFGVHFGQPSQLADGILLRIWRSGPQKERPKLPPAVRSMLERGLLEVRPGPCGMRAFLTPAGVAAVRAVAADRRLMNPVDYSHLRLELGLDEAAQPAA